MVNYRVYNDNHRRTSSEIMLERREEEAIPEAFHFTGKHNCIQEQAGVTFVYMENSSTQWEEMAINTVGKAHVFFELWTSESTFLGDYLTMSEYCNIYRFPYSRYAPLFCIWSAYFVVTVVAVLS